ncbi:hypothetical protein DNK49_22910 [Azoarcus communis]|uniref:Uncharacterized protein n=1 Tax=Parazoarcus communis SWub3 = DSM 12120 TaxID=1121029 RepID=A0A323USQ5_9RHOO|nr:hypothetical protein DNK49_22910 [Azoarcus communis] [Parazoarcus communis SWub3 = DSM 12120]
MLLAACAVTTNAQAWSKSAEEEAQALIGTEYVYLMPRMRIVPGLSCTHEGGERVRRDHHEVSDDHSIVFANCQGHYVVLLTEIVGRVDSSNKLRVLDAVALPPTSYESLDISEDPLQFEYDGYCTLDGYTGTSMIVTLRYGGRTEPGEEIDWQSGLAQAWGYDLDALKIVPIDLKRVVCYVPDEP